MERVRKLFSGIPENLIIPPHYQRHIDESRGKIIVLGGVDTGKTSFSFAFFERIITQKNTAGFIDLDPGQSKIMVPGFQGLIYLKENKIFHKIRIVGSFSPAGYEDVIYRNLSYFLQTLEREGIKDIIVDTCGFVAPPGGVKFKLEIIERVKPDKIFIFDSDDTAPLIHSLLEEGRKNNFTVLLPSRYVIKRDAQRRLNYRKKYLADHFSSSNQIKLNPAKDNISIKIIQNGKAEEIDNENLKFYTEKLPGTLCALELSDGNHIPCLVGGIEFKKEEFTFVLRARGNFDNPVKIIFCPELTAEI